MYFDIEYLQVIIYSWLDIFVFALLISLPLVFFIMILQYFNFIKLSKNDNKW